MHEEQKSIWSIDVPSSPINQTSIQFNNWSNETSDDEYIDTNICRINLLFYLPSILDMKISKENQIYQ